MKFKCHKCNAETEFNKDDYIGFGSKQELGTTIKMELSSSFPKQKSKEVIIYCSNPI